MPRTLRLEAPGALAHIMARGIDGRDMLAGDDDRGAMSSNAALLALHRKVDGTT